MAEERYDQAPADSQEFALFSVVEQLQRVWSLASLVNFGLFLWNGKYRSIVDRCLGMRLTYANRALHRDVSFEFLNRQLVWNAFTEFLLFLLPLLRPQRLGRRLARLPTHPFVLGLLYDTLPRAITRRIGLVRDIHTNTTRLSGRKTQAKVGKYAYLPLECCALCFERLEKAAGVDVDAPPRPPRSMPGVGIPSTDPLHVNKGLIARRAKRGEEDDAAEGSMVIDRATERAQKLAERRAARTRVHNALSTEDDGRPSLWGMSPNGIKYLDALIVTPYQTLPCVSMGHSCQYCYYCIAEKLLDEGMDDNLQDGGWPCLRCGELIWGAERAANVQQKVSDS